MPCLRQVGEVACPEALPPHVPERGRGPQPPEPQVRAIGVHWWGVPMGRGGTRPLMAPSPCPSDSVHRRMIDKRSCTKRYRCLGILLCTQQVVGVPSCATTLVFIILRVACSPQVPATATWCGPDCRNSCPTA